MFISADIQQEYIGCYRDGGAGNRALTGSRNSSESMTVERCQQHCQRAPDTYFGVQVQLCVTATV